MAWKKDAPPVFLRAKPFRPLQQGFLRSAAPNGSDAYAVLDEYVNGGESLWFNNYLRGNNLENLSDRDKERLRFKTATLNRLIKGAPRASQNMVMFRAISEDAPRFKRYHKGDDADFLNQGMISTSLEFSAAIDFLEEDETCCLLVILVPKGTRYLEVLSASAFSNEEEILLPHGSRFKIVRTSVVNGVATYYCIIATQKE